MEILKHGYRIDPERGVVIARRGGNPIRRVNKRYVCIQNWPETCKFVHRIIWEAVNGPLPEGLQINHKNGDRMDNRIANLEAVTPSENTLHAYRLGLRSATGEKNGRAVLTEAAVREIRSSNASTAELASAYGVTRNTIRDVRTGRRWRNVA